MTLLAPSTRRTAPGTVLVAGSALSVVVMFTLAVAAPLAVVVLGLIACGLLHHVLEYRYLAGRFVGLFSPGVWALLALLIGVILLSRSGLVAHRVHLEIATGYLVLAVAGWWGLRGTRRALVMALITVAAAASWTFPDWHFVVLTHLHNVLPVVFLWEWTRRLSSGVRRGLLAVQLCWVVALPLAILFGAVDPLLNNDPGLVAGFVGDGERVIALHAPPEASALVGSRFLTVFALMQSMHYVTWIVLMPLLTTEVTARTERAVPALRGTRIWLLAGGLAVLLGVVFVSDWFEGRALYSMLASYHAYLEFPILLAVLLCRGDVSPPTRS